MEIIISLFGFIVLMILGIVFGTAAERKHMVDLERREVANRDFIRTQCGLFVEPSGQIAPFLICSETVIANDYFKRFRAAWRNFFGGEVKSYNTLMERARRETVIKIIEEARHYGYNAICNLRLEPADIGGNVEKKGSSIVCIVGSATAYHSKIGFDSPAKT